MSLSIKQILRQKNIPYDIEEEINKYLPYFDQEKKKQYMIQTLNSFYKHYWTGDGWTPRRCRGPRLKTYKKVYNGNVALYGRYGARPS